MNIGIIGSGRIGGGLGTVWARKGHRVLFSYSRDQEKLKRLAEAAGPNACYGTPAEAAQFGDVVLLAPTWPQLDDALKQAGSLAGKVVIDPINPLTVDLKDIHTGGDESVAEIIAHKAPGARVVKAYNSITSAVLSTGKGLIHGEKAAAFYCGDDEAAKKVVAQLTEDAGLEPIDCGGLVMARHLEPMAFVLINLIISMKMGGKIALALQRA